jgi:hypothetical protein
MSILNIILLVSGLGAIGGIVNSAIAGEFVLPHFDKSAKVWRPGWVGNVLIGAIAAVVVWGVYGPAASYDLASNEKREIHLTVAQLISSLVVGLGGGHILTTMAQKHAEKVTMQTLVSAVKAASTETQP